MSRLAELVGSPALVPDCELPGCLAIETPAALPSLAAATPAPRHAAQLSVHTAAAAAPPAAASASPGGGALAAPGPDPASLQPCIQCFVRCVAHSPLVQSALLSLELSGSHPPAGEHAAAAGLEWTLAQMLALHVKAGCARGEHIHS